MNETAPAPSPDEMMQDATDAARGMVEGTKPPKSDVEIADQVGRITWKLGERIDEASQQNRRPDHRRGTAYSKPIEMPLTDGGKVESHLRLGARNVAYTDAEGDEVHKAGALWAGGMSSTPKHTSVSTESQSKDSRSSMYTVDKTKLGAYDTELEMNISDDPREWSDRFKPATEEVRSQAISNAAGTLSKIRSGVANAENEKRQTSADEATDKVA